MTRTQLEHLIRAAGAITQENPLVVVGSQSILGRYPHIPASLGESTEADICPLNAPEKADLISGSIGELSTFHDSYGYYAHGLPPESCPLPSGWKSRLVTLKNKNTNGYTGLCLDPADLATSKLAAGREKDIAFVSAMLAENIVNPEELLSLIRALPNEQHRESAIRSLLICTRPRISIPREDPATPARPNQPKSFPTRSDPEIEMGM
jgi:hypothetical protein